MNTVKIKQLLLQGDKTHKDQQILPKGAYENLDLLYDIKTYGDVRTALDTGYFQGLKLSKSQIKNIQNNIKKFHLDI